MERNHFRAAAATTTAGAAAAGRAALLALVVLLASASCALAATTAVVGPSGSAFYTPPSPLPSGPHGTLVWYRTAAVALGAGAPAVQSWNILYETEDALGAQDVATGTLLVPTASYPGTRPVIDYAVGTQGLGQGCAPSEQLAAGTEYETANIVALLKQGWAVVLTDYQGYTTGSESLYTVGAAEGHAALDAVTAAEQIPGTGVSPYAKVAIWGYSQGGQAAAWAAQLQPSYDPSLSLVGVAMGASRPIWRRPRTI